MEQTDIKRRMRSIVERMNTAIAAKKISALRKVGEECHAEAVAILKDIDGHPDFDKLLKEKALQLLVDVRMGSPITLRFV